MFADAAATLNPAGCSGWGADDEAAGAEESLGRWRNEVGMSVAR